MTNLSTNIQVRGLDDVTGRALLQGAFDRLELDGAQFVLSGVLPGSHDQADVKRHVLEELAGRPGCELICLEEGLRAQYSWVALLATPLGALRIVGGGRLWLQVVGRDRERLRRQLAGVLKELEAFRIPDNDERVLVRAVNWGDQCINEHTMRLHCPELEAISGNYSALVRTSLRNLVTELRKSPLERAGSLVLIHGEAGTGKTWALRALLRELCETLRPTVVADPERFFADPRYCMSLVTSSADDDDDDDDDDLDESRERRPNLFVLEDAAELALREGNGDSLSRFLNLTEGILGSGRGDVYLLTFNEELGDLDPAISRKGRCLAQIHFDRLPPEEAAAWLADRGIDREIDEPMSLAELYSFNQEEPGVQPVVERPRSARVGFGA